MISQEVAVRADRFGLRIRTTSDQPGEPSHKQGMQGHAIIHQSNSYTTSFNLREPVTAVGYGFTDLRIYPPPSPSRRVTRRRASANQVTAGQRTKLFVIAPTFEAIARALVSCPTGTEHTAVTSTPISHFLHSPISEDRPSCARFLYTIPGPYNHRRP